MVWSRFNLLRWTKVDLEGSVRVELRSLQCFQGHYLDVVQHQMEVLDLFVPFWAFSVQISIKSKSSSRCSGSQVNLLL